MPAAQRWTVTIDVDEFDGSTQAHARLHARNSHRVVGVGEARLRPTDRDVPEIGDELAVARALCDLANRLLEVSRAGLVQVSAWP